MERQSDTEKSRFLPDDRPRAHPTNDSDPLDPPAFLNDYSVHHLDGVPCQLRPWMWDYFLGNDHDRDYILDGISNGFKIINKSVNDIKSYEVDNYLSAENEIAKPKLDKLLNNELCNGKISVSTVKPKCIHAYGAVPKKNSDKLRPITDCSRPFGRSINDNIVNDRMRYKTVDFATKYVRKGCYFASVDIAAAYRSVPIWPGHRCLQGLKWCFGDLDENNYKYYVDNFLCFGCSSSPGIFQRLSSAVTRIMKRLGYTCIYVEYLDDFLVIADTYDECLKGQLALINVLIKLGFYISWDKVVSPCQRIQFLGLIIDSTDMSVSLPNDKVDKLKCLLVDFMSRSKTKKRELQSLAGHLSFASTVVKGGRTFSRRVIDLVNSVKHGHYFIKLNNSFRKDCQFWLDFIDSPAFNGTAKILDQSPIDIDILQTDSSLFGYGVYFDGRWIAGSWDKDACPCVPKYIDISDNWQPFSCPDVVRSNINILELYPVLIAARKFGHMWRNKRVFVYTDNKSVQCFINKGSSKTSCHAMDCLRELCMISAFYNFHLSAKYLEGQLNVIADRLSRLNDSSKWCELLNYTTTNRIPFHFQTAYEGNYRLKQQMPDYRIIRPTAGKPGNRK